MSIEQFVKDNRNPDGRTGYCYDCKMVATGLIEQYDKTYQNDPDKWVSPERNDFAYKSLKKYGIPRTLLDIGCGSGHTIRYLQWRLYGTKFYGLDLSSEAIRLAKIRVPEATFIQGALEETDFDKQFDMILLMGVIEHFPDLPTSLDKIRRIKSQIGVVYIETPNMFAFTGKEEEGQYVIDLKGEEQPEWHYTRNTWEKILRENGYTILDSLVGQFWYSEFVWIVQ